MFQGIIEEMNKYKETGEMSKELANFFSPSIKMDKFLVNAISTNERNKMKDSSKKLEDYAKKVKELEKYSKELYAIPRFLVINKIDLLADEIEKKSTKFVEQIGYTDKYFTISAAMRQNTDLLSKKLNEFLQKEE